jgi:23S rRNA (adenine2030-N6)-methyltransferase
MALSTVLERLMQAGKPLTYMETHAGRGVYDLSAAEALKTNEAESGIKTLLPKIDKNHPFAKALARIKKEGGENLYPGSPFIARSILHKSQLHLFELHPKEFAELKANISGVNVHNKNGYEGVYDLAPPKERRGLVLIDPSYEIKEEYMEAADFVRALHQAWPEAVILLWYPILEAGHHKKMCELLKDFWQQEIIFKNPKRILGSGLIAVNLRAETIKELEKIKEIF